MFVYAVVPFQSCQAQNPEFGKPSGLVPLGLSTKTSASGPETPKCWAPACASAAMSACAAFAGAAAASSTQVPRSTEPPNEGEPFESGYWVVMVDQLSCPVPRPPK